MARFGSAPSRASLTHTDNGLSICQQSFFNLLAPFELAGHRGPNLLKPRPSLRIVPLKVAGEPHVVGSRITSRSLVALHKRGFESAAIADMYGISPQSVGDAIDLENQLSASAPAA